MSLAEKMRLTAEQYLLDEEQADTKHEYQDGEAWAMVGAIDNHVTIAGNLFVLFKQHLKNTPCRTYISDMKVRVEKADAFFYPDVMVTCNKDDATNNHYKQHPVFIAEILSPSTEAFDRGNKFNAYRQLDSLKAYWLIDTQSRRIDSFTRTENDDWLLHSYDQADDKVILPTLGIDFMLAALYEDTLPN